MESVSNKLEEIQNQKLTGKNKKIAVSVQQITEELEKLGFDKKPEYTIPLADTVGKGFYSAFSKK